MKDRFTAKVCCFDGVLGYMVFQWHENNIVCSQFVAGAAYSAFCDAIGCKPIMED
jgi:hypothetical protein